MTHPIENDAAYFCDCETDAHEKPHHTAEDDVTFSPHTGTPFEGRYASCALDSNGNCYRWNHDHPPAEHRTIPPERTDRE